MKKMNSWAKWACLAFCMLMGLNTSAQNYAAVADDVDAKIAATQQLTNVPTIYLTIPDINIDNIDNELKKEWFTNENGVRYYDGTYFSAKIQVVDDANPDLAFTDYVRIKVRGNSTSVPSKKSYRLKFEKSMVYTDENGTDTVAASKHDLLGAGYSERSWTLLANVFDHSRIQNAINYHIGQYLGMPFCPGYRFVDLVINGKYRGTYQVCDHVNVGKNRVNINEDTDQMLEFVGWSNDMFKDIFGVSTSLGWVNIKNPDEEDVADDEAYKSAVLDFINQWNYATDIETYNDLETLAKFYLGTMLTGDYDAALVAKVYRVADGPLCWGPLWDKDLAFGNSSLTTTQLVEDLNNGTLGNFFKKLHTDAPFLKKAKQIMDAVDFDQLYAKLAADIDALVTKTNQTWQLDYKLWGDGQLYDWADKRYGLGSQTAYAAQIKQFLAERIPFVKETITDWYDAAWQTVDFTFDAAAKDYSPLSAVAGKVVNLTMTNRTFTANVWNDISLPFNADEEVLKAVFGDEYELREFVGVSEDGSTMLFETPANKAIKARNPYLIKPSKEVAAQPVFLGVIPVSPVVNYNFKNGETVTFGNYSFIGNMCAKEWVTACCFQEDGTFADSQSYSLFGGARSYVNVLNGAALPLVDLGEGGDILLGDADGNGVVDNADAVAILRHLVGSTPTNFNPQNADVNADGTIDNADAVAILRIIVNETGN